MLAIPLVASSLSGVVFQLVDLGFVSRLGEQATTAVIVTNQSLRQVFFVLVFGASFGAQGLIARHVGAGRTDRADHVAGQMILMGLGFSLVMAAVGLSAARPMLAAMNVSKAVLEIGVPYVQLIFALNLPFVVVFLASAILQGAGDSTTPLFVSLIQTALGLGGEWLLMFGHAGLPALGILGIPLGLLVGQGVAVAVYGFLLLRGSARIHIRLHHLRPDLQVVREIARLSWPPALQMLGGFGITVLFLRLVGSFGEQAQTAYAIGLRLSMLGPMLVMPLAGAAATLVGQNLGAGDIRRAWRAMGVGLAASVAVMWTIASGLFWFRYAILGAFSDDPQVIAIGGELLAFQAGTFALYAFFFVFFRTLQSAGDVLAPMVLSLAVSLLITLPLGFGLSLEAGAGWGPTGVFAATLIGALAGTVSTGAWVATGRWTRVARRPGSRKEIAKSGEEARDLR
ncbi:MAG: MATE family efflux transporter [Myxococcota bacterium]